MIVLYILGGLLALVILLLLIPLGVDVLYTDKLELNVRVCFFPIRLLPKKENESSEQSKVQNKFKQKIASFARWMLDKANGLYKAIQKWAVSLKSKHPRRKQKTAASAAGKKVKEKGLALLMKQRGFLGAVGLILRVSGIALNRTGRIFKGVRLSYLEIHAVIGGENAADAAVNYGRWCAVLFPAIAAVLNAMRGKKRQNVCIEPCFVSNENNIYIKARAWVLPVLALWHAAAVLLRTLIDEVRSQAAEAVN